MKFLSLYKFKFVLGTALIMALLSFLAVLYTTQTAEKTASRLFLQQSKAILEEGESYADPAEVQEMFKNQDPEDYAYEDACDNLFGVKSTFGCERIFVAVPFEGNEFMYMADGSGKPEDKDKFTGIGVVEDFSVYGKTPFDVMSSKDKETSVTSIVNREGKDIVAVFHPIMEDAEFVGFLVIEFDAADAVAEINARKKILIVLCCVISILVMALVLFLSILFFKNVRKVTTALSRVSEGSCNLTLRIPAKGKSELDSLASACNNVMAQLQQIVSKVRVVAKQLAANSKMLCMRADENQRLMNDTKTALAEIDKRAVLQNDLTSEFADGFADLKQTVSELEKKISAQESTVVESSYSVGDISDEISNATEVIGTISEEYSQVVSETVSGKHKQEVVTQQVATIVELSKNLEKMNTVISDISAKTNLLAMNAAIEAAHAGTAGKGFSVVASEIRALAESSSKQTDSIMTVIGDIQKAVADIVQASNESSESFGQLGSKVRSLDSLFEKLKKGIDNQHQEAQSVKDSIKQLRESSVMIAETYGKIRSGTKASVDRLEKFKQSSALILESEQSAGNRLFQMEQFAEKTASQAEQNVNLAVAVNNMLAVYKV